MSIAAHAIVAADLRSRQHRLLIRALTLDLDDTLWAVAPAIERAERAVHAYLEQHCPRTAQAFPIPRMRQLRDQVAREHPQLAHDFTAQRKLSLRAALSASGEALDHVEPAFEAFFAARNQVELYADVASGLHRLAARWPIAALTNGNADLRRIGLAGHFRFSLGAREHGAAKPEPSIFLAACERLQVEPSQVLHIGDDPHLDVAGAAGAGLRSCWVNRHGARWPDELPPADIEIQDFGQLLQRLEHPSQS